MKLLSFKLFNKGSTLKPFITLPLTLSRKRIYILPTRHGWVFILILLAMLIGSVNYKINLGFLLTFLLGGMAFVSIFHSYRNLLSIQILAVTAQPVFAGDRAVFKFSIRTKEPARAAVAISLPNAEKIVKDFDANKDNWIRIPVAANQRGIFRPGSLLIATQYPLGLFRAWSTIRLDAKCLVYPRPLSGPLTTADDAGAVNGEEGRDIPGAEDFQELKSYQQGDPLQHIAWKALSRGQGLFTKMFVAQAGSTAMLDFDALLEPHTERKLSRLCDMILQACSHNLVFGLKLPGKVIDPNRGEAHRQKCLKALALYAMPDTSNVNT